MNKFTEYLEVAKKIKDEKYYTQILFDFAKKFKKDGKGMIPSDLT